MPTRSRRPSAIVDYSLKELKVKKPAMIYTSNDYGVGGMETVTAALKKAGVEPAATVRYNQGDQDFSAQLLRIRQAGADLLYVWSFAAEAGHHRAPGQGAWARRADDGRGATTTPLFPRGAGPGWRRLRGALGVPLHGIHGRACRRSPPIASCSRRFIPAASGGAAVALRPRRLRRDQDLHRGPAPNRRRADPREVRPRRSRR